jgi:hypothetical protein
MSVPDEILKKIATPADLGAFLVGFGAGFAVDVFGWLGGIPTVDPLTAGLGVGATALGVKQGVQGSIARRLRASRIRKHANELAQFIRSAPNSPLKRHLNTLERIEALAATLNPDAADNALAEIEKELLTSP